MENETTDEIRVGQTVYLVGGYVGTGREVAVLSVGRKWVNLDYGRGCRMTKDWSLEHGRGSVWPSAEAYREWKRLVAEWSALCGMIANRYHPPTGVTCEKMAEVMRILGLDKEWKEDSGGT